MFAGLGSSSSSSIRVVSSCSDSSSSIRLLLRDRAAGDSVGVHDFANLVLLRIRSSWKKEVGSLVVLSSNRCRFPLRRRRPDVSIRFDFFFVEVRRCPVLRLGLFTAASAL